MTVAVLIARHGSEVRGAVGIQQGAWLGSLTNAFEMVFPEPRPEGQWTLAWVHWGQLGLQAHYRGWELRGQTA